MEIKSRTAKKKKEMEVVLTRSARDLATDSVPLLSEVVLDALEAVQGGHLLRSLACARLTARVVRRVLMLHLRC